MVVPFISSIIRVESSRRFIAPGIDAPISSTRRFFPLRFRRQALAGPLQYLTASSQSTLTTGRL